MSDEPKDQLIAFKGTESLKQRIYTQAGREDISVSDLLREIIQFGLDVRENWRFIKNNGN